MFKKLITLMMVLTIFTTQAQAHTSKSLKAAFDELNYSLSVEWDGQDKSVYAEHVKAFSAKVRQLQANGMTNEEFIDFVKSEATPAVAKNIEEALNVIEINQMSPAEASAYMTEVMKQSYAKGASWNGALVIGLVGVAAIVTLAVFLASTISTPESSTNN
jgi:hypothetical protein